MNADPLAGLINSNYITMQASEQFINYGIPGTLPPNELELRMALLTEEHAEAQEHTLEYQAATSLKAARDAENKLIDDMCDVIYVAVGTLVALGVDPAAHIAAVVEANNAKFPNGVGVPHPTIPGKFGKPEGWTPPDHEAIQVRDRGPHYAVLLAFARNLETATNKRAQLKFRRGSVWIETQYGGGPDLAYLAKRVHAGFNLEGEEMMACLCHTLGSAVVRLAVQHTIEFERAHAMIEPFLEKLLPQSAAGGE